MRAHDSKHNLTTVQITKCIDPPNQSMGTTSLKRVLDTVQFDLLLLVMEPAVIISAISRGRAKTSGERVPIPNARGFIGLCQTPIWSKQGLQLKVDSAKWDEHGAPSMFAFHVRSLISQIREFSALQNVVKVGKFGQDLGWVCSC